MSAPTKPPDDVLERLLPRLRRPSPWSFRTLVEGELAIELVLSSPDGSAPVDASDLEAWGIDPEVALEAALANLGDRSLPSRWQAVHTVPGMQIYLPSDHEASARALLISELIDDLPDEGALFAIPAADQLYVVPLRDFEHVQAMQVVVHAARVAHRDAAAPLTDQLFWTDGRRILHIQVTHGEQGTDIEAPPGFLETVERLTSLRWIGMAAEA